MNNTSETENDMLYQRIHPNARKAWLVQGLILSSFLMTVACVTFYFLNIIWIPLGAGLICIPVTLVSPLFEYKQWKYRITGNEVEYIHGIVFVKRTIIPISRIQHIELKQGPVQKLFNISGITIFTAGSSHEIEALSMDKAQEIIDNIRTLILKENDDASSKS